MKAINRTEVLNKYRGQWVAFKQDQETVLTNGKTLKEVDLKVKKLGYPRPIFSFMHPDLDKTWIGRLAI